MDLFGRTIVYESRAEKAILEAENRWNEIDEIINAFEWVLMRDVEIGHALSESGNIRGFLYPGARSKKEPDVDIIYEIDAERITIRDLIFSDAKGHYAGKA